MKINNLTTLVVSKFSHVNTRINISLLTTRKKNDTENKQKTFFPSQFYYFIKQDTQTTTVT